MKVSTYAKCGTCRKAIRWLEERNIVFSEVPIRETPPPRAELRRMLGFQGGEIRRLFNISGMDYRSLGLKEELPRLSDEEAIELLHGNGNLVKRPFLIDDSIGLVGFRADEWRERLG